MKYIILLISLVAVVFSGPIVAGTLYTVDEDPYPYATFHMLDPVSGAATFIGETDPSLEVSPSFAGGAYDSLNDKLFFTTFYSEIAEAYGLVEIDRLTGLSTYIGPHVDTWNVFATAYDSLNDVLYAFDYDKNYSLATVNRTTGETTVVGPVGGEATVRIDGMAYDADTDTLYGVSNSTLYTLSRTTGLGSAVGGHGVTTGHDIGLAIDPDTGIMYMTEGESGGLHTIDKITGTATLVGLTGLNAPGSLAIIPDVVAVPVPLMSHLGILLMVGLFAWLGFRFRRYAQD